MTDSSSGTGSGQVGPRQGTGGHLGGLWRDGAAPLWPGDPQLVILAFQGLFAAVCRSCATGTICQDSPLPRASPPSPAPSKHREHHTRDLNVASSSELLCLVRAPGPLQRCGCFLKKHGSNLSLVKFHCVNESFFMFLIVQFCSNISYLCVDFFSFQTIPSCNSNRKGFSIFNRLTLKELSWNQIKSVNLSVLGASC